MRNATLALLVKDAKICLGVKKRKLGKGKLNGFGGFQEAGESIEEAMLRELREEARVDARRYWKVGEMTYVFPKSPRWDQVVHIYLVTDWSGVLTETDEMSIGWYGVSAIPYGRMWDNDQYWLPKVLKGDKIRGRVVHSEDVTLEQRIEVVKGFSDSDV